MNSELKMLLGIGGVSVVIIGGFLLFSSANTPSETAQASILVRDNSNKIVAENAEVTLVEFGDYQCPACASANPSIKRLLSEYKAEVTFVFRHFPLPQHKNGELASEAAEAAGEQGKYWEMHDKLYENQNEWSELENAVEVFVKYARELNLDTDKFRNSVESKNFSGKINSDKADGTSIGVNSTPTFFINGERFTITPSYENLESKIKGLLEKSE